MKKTLLLIASMLLVISVWSQSKPPITPPDTVMVSFQSMFPGIEKIRWNKAKNSIYISLFKDAEGIKTYAYFAPTGKWLQTKRYLYELPLHVEDAIYDIYEYAELKKLIEIETSKGRRYQVMLDSGKVLAKLILDEDAIVLKKQEKPKGEKKKQ